MDSRSTVKQESSPQQRALQVGCWQKSFHFRKRKCCQNFKFFVRSFSLIFNWVIFKNISSLFLLDVGFQTSAALLSACSLLSGCTPHRCVLVFEEQKIVITNGWIFSFQHAAIVKNAFLWLRTQTTWKPLFSVVSLHKLCVFFVMACCAQPATSLSLSVSLALFVSLCVSVSLWVLLQPNPEKCQQGQENWHRMHVVRNMRIDNRNTFSYNLTKKEEFDSTLCCCNVQEYKASSVGMHCAPRDVWFSSTMHVGQEQLCIAQTGCWGDASDPNTLTRPNAEVPGRDHFNTSNWRSLNRALDSFWQENDWFFLAFIFL